MKVASEHDEQVTLFERVALECGTHPELQLLFAIPNAGAGRQKGQAGKMKAEGVKPGVPDVCLPVARGDYHGLFIEMKARDGGHSTPEHKARQAWWQQQLKTQGYYVTECPGYDVALQVIMSYVKRPPTQIMSEELYRQMLKMEMPRGPKITQLPPETDIKGKLIHEILENPSGILYVYRQSPNSLGRDLAPVTHVRVDKSIGFPPSIVVDWNFMELDAQR